LRKDASVDSDVKSKLVDTRMKYLEQLKMELELELITVAELKTKLEEFDVTYFKMN